MSCDNFTPAIFIMKLVIEQISFLIFDSSNVDFNHLNFKIKSSEIFADILTLKLLLTMLTQENQQQFETANTID